MGTQGPPRATPATQQHMQHHRVLVHDSMIFYFTCWLWTHVVNPANHGLRTTVIHATPWSTLEHARKTCRNARMSACTNGHRILQAACWNLALQIALQKRCRNPRGLARDSCQFGARWFILLRSCGGHTTSLLDCCCPPFGSLTSTT